MENESATENEPVITTEEPTSVDRLTRRLDHMVPDF